MPTMRSPSRPSRADGCAATAGRPAAAPPERSKREACDPFRIIGPIVEELAPSYEGKAVITKMNVDENQNVPQKFGVTSIPTLMIFKNGQLVDRAIGAMPKPMLQKFIDKNI